MVEEVAHVLSVLPYLWAQPQRVIQFDTLSLKARLERYPMSIVDVDRNVELLEGGKFIFKPFITQNS